jgi:hypothetical protein
MKIPLLLLALALVWLAQFNRNAARPMESTIEIIDNEETKKSVPVKTTNQHKNKSKSKSHNRLQTKSAEPEKLHWNLYTFGEYNEEDVTLANKTIHEVFTFGTRFKGHRKIPSYCEKSEVIDGNECLSAMQQSNERGIFITRQNINYYDLAVRGLTKSYGRVILLKSNPYFEKTLIHEIGHTYGLEHCSNLACVMAIYNDDEGTRKFCETCVNQIPDGVLRDRWASTLQHDYSEVESAEETYPSETISTEEE